MAVYCEAVPYQNPDHPSVHPVFRGRAHIHLMADTPLELRAAARKYRLKYSWIQYEHSTREHFDVVGSLMTKIFLDNSVLKLERKEWVKRWRDNEFNYGEELVKMHAPVIPVSWYYAQKKGDT